MAKQRNIWANLVFWFTRLAILVVLVGSALAIYQILLRKIISGNGWLTGFVLLWLFTAYLVLPRLHRWLTKLYVPDYFIGRVRTGDGLLGDPVNLALLGTKDQLIAAMEKAGWTRAEELSLASTLKKGEQPRPHSVPRAIEGLASPLAGVF